MNLATQNKNATISSAPAMWIVLFCILALASVWHAHRLLINHDVGCYIAFAELIWQGKEMYRDMIEINSPLIVYISFIPVAISQWTGFKSTDLFFLFISLLGFFSTWLSYGTLKQQPIFRDPKSLPILLLTLCCSFFIFPAVLNEFGQREHIFMILTFPYVVMLMGYMQGLPAARNIKILVGILAGIGFSIKPHFIVIFAFAELAWLLFHRSFSGMFRIESLLIGAIIVFYHLWCALYFPEYFELLPLFMDAYTGYKAPLHFIAIKSIWYLSPLYFFLVFAVKKQVNIRIITLLTLLIVASSLLYIVPLTDYYYHLIPAHIFVFWLGIITLLTAKQYKYCIPLLLIWVLPGIAMTNLHKREVIIPFAEKVESIAVGEEVAVLSSSVSPTFPMINQSGSFWGLSLPYMIHLPQAYMNARGTHAEPNYRTMDEMDETERFFTERTISDLESLPKLIIFDKRPETQAFLEMKFDMQTYYMKQPRFQKLWKHYDYVDTVSDFAIYQRKD
ncbi:MAG: hypothetical protein ACN2B6_08185 [Rickettsiales bacterium]